MTDFSNLKALNPHTARNEYFAYIHATMIQFKISIFKHCSGKEKGGRGAGTLHTHAGVKLPKCIIRFIIDE